MNAHINMAETGKPYKKVVYIEFMRIAACFLVIVNHTVGPIYRDRGPSLTWLAGILYFFVCKIAVPLFLMILGAVLLPKEDPPKKTIERISRGGVVLAAASAVYYIYYGTKKGETLGLFDFFQKLIRTNITNAFWYLYLYLGLLCLLPILQKLVRACGKKDLQWLLLLSVGLLGTVPLVHIFLPDFGVSGHFTGVLLSTYIGVVLCGYYIERYVNIDRMKFSLAAVSFVLLIAFQTVATYFLYQKDPSKYMLLDNRNFITITGSAIAFYIMVKYLFSRFPMGHKSSRVITYLGGLTFGIYLLSDLTIDLTRPIHAMLCAHVHVILAMGLWELLIFASCAVFATALKQIPGLKKWI